MGSRTGSLALALLLAVLLAGCGEEGQPKRAVDARTEVLGFYAADAPAVAVLRPVPSGDVVALDRAAKGSPAWSALREMVLGPLHGAGLGRRRLARLIEPLEEIEGIDAAAATLGAPTPGDLAAGRPLLVLATDQSDLLTRMLAGSARRGILRPAGRLDEAMLYRSGSDAFAARDGVLVSAHGLGQVRTAIERRDGDSDEQLDEDVVHSIFNEFDPQGPVLVYANVPQLAAAPEVAQYVSDRSVLESGDDAAASVRPVAESIEVDVVVRLERELAQPPGGLGSTPRPVAFEVPGVGSLSGVGSASADEVRLHLTAAR